MDREEILDSKICLETQPKVMKEATGVEADICGKCYAVCPYTQGYLNSGEAVILDVRTQEEYDSGHIKGAVPLSVDEIIEETAREVIPTKDSQVLVCCRSGNRSVTASEALVQLGYREVYEFGGIQTCPMKRNSDKGGERP